MKTKITPWQKAVLILSVTCGQLDYPHTVGKEIWVLPPQRKDGDPGRDPVTDKVMMYEQGLMWYPTNVLSMNGEMIQFYHGMLELKPEFREKVDFIKLDDFLALPDQSSLN